MSNWKFTDATNAVVFRINADGSCESCRVEAIADWIADGNTPEPYVAPIPQVVTMRQANRALLAAGLLDAVDSAIAQAPRESQIDWERAQDVDRANPLVASLAASLGLSDAQLDALFVAAAAL